MLRHNSFIIAVVSFSYLLYLMESVVSLTKFVQMTLYNYWIIIVYLQLLTSYLIWLLQDISNNFIGSYGCAKMAEMLDANVTLKTLSLAGEHVLTGNDLINYWDIFTVLASLDYFQFQNIWNCKISSKIVTFPLFYI